MSSPARPALGHMERIELEVELLRREIETTPLERSERQYVSRCFELLEIELRAVRQFLLRTSMR